MPAIVTERLILRRPRRDDLDDVLAYRNHPGVVFSAAPMEPMTIDAATTLLEVQAGLDPVVRDCWLMRAIEHRQTGAVIGEVGIFLSHRTAHGDLGWIVHPAHQRRGIAVEAARAFIPAAFADHGLHRLTAACEQRNVASSRVMERLGMRREGTFRQSRRVPDGWQDEFLYALLRDEWR